mmetsp:Transcript_146343/g.364983  ORF Transcript_146343/g.364983 Transcript_146343/m.364983 type:complete len:329 (+) Transcript_146343:187-1173(+)
MVSVMVDHLAVCKASPAKLLGAPAASHVVAIIIVRLGDSIPATRTRLHNHARGQVGLQDLLGALVPGSALRLLASVLGVRGFETNHAEGFVALGAPHRCGQARLELLSLLHLHATSGHGLLDVDRRAATLPWASLVPLGLAQAREKVLLELPGAQEVLAQVRTRLCCATISRTFGRGISGQTVLQVTGQASCAIVVLLALEGHGVVQVVAETNPAFPWYSCCGCPCYQIRWKHHRPRDVEALVHTRRHDSNRTVLATGAHASGDSRAPVATQPVCIGREVPRTVEAEGPPAYVACQWVPLRRRQWNQPPATETQLRRAALTATAHCQC